MRHYMEDIVKRHIQLMAQSVLCLRNSEFQINAQIYGFLDLFLLRSIEKY